MKRELVLLCIVLGIAAAFIGEGPLDPKPDKYKDVEGCFIEALDTVVPFGESRPSAKDCFRYICETDHVKIQGCADIAVLPPRRLVVHSERPYPDCCPVVEDSEAGATKAN